MIKVFRNCVYMLISLAVLSAPASALAEASWQSLAPGMDYTSIDANNTGGKILAFRIDLKQYKLTLARAQDQDERSTNVAKLGITHGGVLAINGGFFDPLHNPLGLRIRDGQVLNPMRPISWWGVFYIVNNKQAHITSQKNFNLSPNISFAVQSGPRLVVNGSIPNLKQDYAARSGLGIDKQGRVIIAISSNVALTPQEFANFLAKSSSHNGLDCFNALNLDGGSSSQLYAHVGDFSLLIPSFSNVADAVVVKK